MKIMSEGYFDHNFPSDENYSVIVSVLKGEAESLEVPNYMKTMIYKNFVLSITNGVEQVLERMTSRQIVKRSRVRDVLKKCHDDANHPGVVNTQFNVSLAYARVPVSVVSYYVSNCEYCISKRPSSSTILKEPFAELDTPNATKTIQHSLHVRVENNGEQHFIHLKDPETKYTWAALLDGNTAKDVANFIRKFFNKFGAPRILDTDNKPVFMGSEFRSMLQSEFPNTMLKKISRLDSDEVSGNEFKRVKRRYTTRRILPKPTLSSGPVLTVEMEGELVSQIDIEYEPISSESKIKDEPVTDTDFESVPVLLGLKTEIKDDLVSNVESEWETLSLGTKIKKEPVSDTEIEHQTISEVAVKVEPVSDTEFENEPLSDWSYY